jgi:hypothetical protein
VLRFAEQATKQRGDELPGISGNYPYSLKFINTQFSID